jgi:hypothetical protein
VTRPTIPAEERHRPRGEQQEHVRKRGGQQAAHRCETVWAAALFTAMILVTQTRHKPGNRLMDGSAMTAKTWFITGTSRGFGREWAIAALDRGDTVAATARDVSCLDDLVVEYREAILPIRLDVTDRDADFAAVRQVHDHFGRLDIVVNNAGYGSSARSRALRTRDPGAAGDEPARRAVGHPGRLKSS